MNYVEIDSIQILVLLVYIAHADGCAGRAAKVATGWWAIAEALRQMLAGAGVPAAVATGAVAAMAFSTAKRRTARPSLRRAGVFSGRALL